MLLYRTPLRWDHAFIELVEYGARFGTTEGMETKTRRNLFLSVSRYSVNLDLEKETLFSIERVGWRDFRFREPFYFMVVGVSRQSHRSTTPPASAETRGESTRFSDCRGESVNFVKMGDGKWKVTWEMDPVKAHSIRFQRTLREQDDGAQPTQTLRRLKLMDVRSWLSRSRPGIGSP